MSSQIQTNFTSGALDPNLRGRVDVKHYYNGAEIMRNVIVSPQGGFSMREGLAFMEELPPKMTQLAAAVSAPEGLSAGVIANIDDDDRTTTITTNNVMGVVDPYVVAGLDYGGVTDPVVPLVIIRGLSLSIAASSTQFQVQYSSDFSTWNTFANLSIVDDAARDYVLRAPAWPTRIAARYWRLARVGAADLTTALVNLADFLVMNDAGVSNVKMIPFEFSIVDRYMMVVTDRALSVFRDGVFKAIFEVPYLDADVLEINWTQSLDTLLIVQEDHPPQLIQRQGSDTAWAIANQAFDYIPLFAFSPVTSNPATTLTPSAAEGSVTLTAGAATFSAAHVGQLIEGGGGRVRITKFTSTTIVQAITLFPFFNTDTIASGDWTLTTGFEDAWSDTRGWPRSIAFHEARTVIGGSRDRPSTVWMSRIGLFFDFNLGHFLDDDGIDVTIQSDDQTIIHNVMSGTNLQIFTAGSEYFVPQADEQPITPATVNIKHATSRGSEPNIRAVDVAGETLFVQRQGRAMREFVYSETDRNYSAANISLLAAHLLKTPVAMDVRQTTDTNQADLVVLVNADGSLAILTTLRDQEVTAWVEADTLGAGGLFKSVGVDLDDIFFAVQRTIGGVNKLFLERLCCDLLADSGIVQTMSGTTVLGLEHLEGETVRIVVDGVLHDDEVVTGGSVTLDASVDNALVEVGLAYTWEVTDMPVVRELQDGTRVDGKKRVIEQIVELLNSKDIIVDGQRPAFRTFGTGAASPLDKAIASYAGRKRLEGRLGYDDLAQTTLAGDKPLPTTVLSMEKRIIP